MSAMPQTLFTSTIGTSSSPFWGLANGVVMIPKGTLIVSDVALVHGGAHIVDRINLGLQFPQSTALKSLVLKGGTFLELPARVW